MREWQTKERLITFSLNTVKALINDHPGNLKVVVNRAGHLGE